MPEAVLVPDVVDVNNTGCHICRDSQQESIESKTGGIRVHRIDSILVELRSLDFTFIMYKI
jgi:hypothetical protein